MTKPGLEQPVGAAAINSVPRRMILQEAEAECLDAGYEGGLLLTVFVPDGEALAKLRIEGLFGMAMMDEQKIFLVAQKDVKQG